MTRVSPESTATPWAGPQAVSVAGSSDPVCAQGPLWETGLGGLWAGATGAGLGKEKTSLKRRAEEGSGVACMGWGCRALGGGGGGESEGCTRCECGCVGVCTRVGVHRCAPCSGSAHPKMLMTQLSEPSGDRGGPVPAALVATPMPVQRGCRGQCRSGRTGPAGFAGTRAQAERLKGREDSAAGPELPAPRGPPERRWRGGAEW